MKKSTPFFCVFITFSITLIGQEVESVTIPVNDKGLAEYSEVIPIDSASKNDLYIFALEWVNKNYKSGKSVIQTTDQEGGIIIGKANGHTLVYNNMGVKVEGGHFSYIISIYCKENRYKYVIDHIKYNADEMFLNSGADLAEIFPDNWTGLLGKNKQTRREWKSFQLQADKEFKLIIENLKNNMRSSKKKNEW